MFQSNENISNNKVENKAVTLPLNFLVADSYLSDHTVISQKTLQLDKTFPDCSHASCT